MKRIYIQNTVECPRRTLDSANLRQYFVENGYEMVDRPRDADDILVVTCGAWDRPERKSIEAIDALKLHDSRLVVLGCLGEINKPLLDRHFQGPTIPPKRLHEIDALYEHERSFTEFDNGNDATRYARQPYRLQMARNSPFRPRNILPLVRTTWRHARHLGLAVTARLIKGRLLGQREYSLKISQGCNFNCTFCSIPQAVGRLVNRPLAEVVNEARRAVADGYDIITLITDEAGSFGIDNGESFLDLLDRLTEITGLVELNVSDLLPAWLVKHGEKLLQYFDRKKILRLEVPVQSGSQRIVDRMRRGYQIAEVEAILVELKSHHPYLHLNSHLIAGFPSETSEDIEKTIAFVSGVPINTGNVFMYSERPGSAAAEMSDKLPPNAKQRAMVEYFDRLVEHGFCAEFCGDGHESIFFSR